MYENMILLYSNIYCFSYFFELRLTHLNLCNKKISGFHIMLLSCLISHITPEIRMFSLSCVNFRGKVSRTAYKIKIFFCCLRHILIFITCCQPNTNIFVFLCVEGSINARQYCGEYKQSSTCNEE